MKIFKKMFVILILSLVFVSCKSENVKEVKKQETQSAMEKKEPEKETFKGKYIVSADYVKNNLNNEKVLFVDTRGEKAAKSTGTLNNAIVMSWQDIADVANKKPGEDGWGHILKPEELEKKLSEFGLAKEKEIILISTANAGWGEDGRILWELKAAGYTNLKMVDGGFESLKKAGVKVDSDVSAITKVNVKVEKIDYKNTINTKELTKDKAQYKIIDSREKDEYEGATKFGEAKGGHIPGAVNIPYSSLYNEQGVLKSNAEIEKLFKEKGFDKNDKIVTYCTGGIRSAFMQLILEMSGYENVKNYEGSYYNWSAVNDVEK